MERNLFILTFSLKFKNVWRNPKKHSSSSYNLSVKLYIILYKNQPFFEKNNFFIYFVSNIALFFCTFVHFYFV